MSKYKYEVVFEADDDQDASEQIWGTSEHPEWGAADSLSGIHTEALTNAEGEPL